MRTALATTSRASIAALARKFKSRAIEVSRGLAKPMLGIAMVDDPLMPMARDGASDASRLLARRACQYATWRGQQTGQIPRDASGLDTIWWPDSATVAFIRADASQAEVCRITIPEHIMAFDASAPALALPAPEDAKAARCEDTCEMGLAVASPAPAAAPALARETCTKPARQRLAKTKTFYIIGRRGVSSACRIAI